MRKHTYLAGLLFVAAGWWFTSLDNCITADQPLTQAKAPADLVIRNGKILTLDAKSSTVEAVAIRDGVFVLVGSNAEIQKLVGAKTRVIDAQGRTVVPGLIESHV